MMDKRLARRNMSSGVAFFALIVLLFLVSLVWAWLYVKVLG